MSVLWSSVMHCGAANAGPREHDERLVVLGGLDAVGLRVRERGGGVAGALRLDHVEVDLAAVDAAALVDHLGERLEHVDLVPEVEAVTLRRVDPGCSAGSIATTEILSAVTPGAVAFSPVCFAVSLVQNAVVDVNGDDAGRA